MQQLQARHGAPTDSFEHVGGWVRLRKGAPMQRLYRRRTSATPPSSLDMGYRQGTRGAQAGGRAGIAEEEEAVGVGPNILVEMQLPLDLRGDE